ncbi:Cytochrome P450 [Streptomyces sp. Ag82_O1-12]|uniref:cytochrome P450 n=1 Tax=unclassified Streptomyces TaxID=2593676 RepID=UPI000BCFBAF0|nr:MULTISPECIES: cytochrome P450 [unclassified Streptomyces]SMQ18925.1 Cytochrome P450 [Streptomyces sp. Ag82_O1-12]SOD47965.1 Cytochrome P450 [Streptomyces sp. Ag82_G6-1]
MPASSSPIRPADPGAPGRTGAISSGSGTRAVPNLGLRDQLAGLRAIRKDQVAFLNRAIHKHGDVFRLRLLGNSLVMLNHPDHVQRVLIENRENYDKENFLYRTVRPVLRNGLIGAVGGESWHRQRRLMQPSFHRPKIAAFADTMSDETDAMLQRWEHRYQDGDVVPVVPDVGHTALRIVTRNLFGADVGPTTEAIEQDFIYANHIMGNFFRFPFPPLHWPTPSHLRLRQLIENLHNFVADMIEQRDAHGDTSPNLLGILADAIDEDTGHHMDKVQLQHEVVNIMVGGYETTTGAASFLLYLIARHPEIQERMHDEVAEVLDGGKPDFAAVARLKYTRMVLDETLRLRGPAWQTMRRAVGPDTMGDFAIEPNSGIYINFYTMHRHRDFWPDPERFDPERFTPEAIAARPKSAYMPFGAGPRICIGKHFALTELVIIAAMIVQKYRLRLPEGRPSVGMEQLVTLRPKHDVLLRLERR